MLRDLSLSLSPGEIFGYLGPNGSGKTTTLKVLIGLVKADAGSARILGYPMQDRRWRFRVGYLPEHPYFYDYLTPREYLRYVSRLLDLDPVVTRERVDRLIDRMGLSRVADLPLRRFSKGMAQRLGLAQALLNEPDLVFLDEPMSGLDPMGRHLVRDVILELKERGATVFFSTHILSDAEALCDRVALIREGSLLRLGRLDEILAGEVSHYEVLLSGGRPAALEPLPPGVRLRDVLGERWRLEVAESGLLRTLDAAVAAGARVLSVQSVRQSLEEFFVREMEGASKAEAGTSVVAE